MAAKLARLEFELLTKPPGIGFIFNGSTNQTWNQMNSQPILQIESVTKAFGGILALNDVSFEVYPGEILGIIGPNGSGKTTVVNCITGFVPKTKGRVLFKGRDISNKPAHNVRRGNRTQQIGSQKYQPRLCCHPSTVQGCSLLS